MYKSLIAAALLSVLPTTTFATELGTFCWEDTLVGVINLQLQVTQHGQFYEVNAKATSFDGINTSQVSLMGSGYVVGDELRIGGVGMPLNAPYDTESLVLQHGVFIVNLNDLSAIQHTFEENPLVCSPAPAPCVFSIPYTPVACPL